jgi:hypothetical protein
MRGEVKLESDIGGHANAEKYTQPDDAWIAGGLEQCGHGDSEISRGPNNFASNEDAESKWLGFVGEGVSEWASAVGSQGLPCS